MQEWILALFSKDDQEEVGRSSKVHITIRRLLVYKTNTDLVKHAFFVSHPWNYYRQILSRMGTSHGALICTNPDCPAVKAGYTTFNRDSVGAAGVGLAGTTTLLSSDRIPLPPYNPSPTTTTTSPTTTSKFQLDEKFSLVSPSLRSYGMYFK